MSYNRKPAYLSTRLAILAAATVVATMLPALSLGIFPATAGLLGVGFGTWHGSRKWLDRGVFFLFTGVLLMALSGGAAPLALVGTAATVVALDVGENAIGLGEQLGHEINTARTELYHAGASALVGLLGIVLGYGIYTVAWGGQPILALVVLVFALLFLITGLRE